MAEQRDPDQALERSGDELESRLDRLEDHIDDAKDELAARQEDAQEPGEDLAGDWEGKARDAPRGEDPEGAAEDVESPDPSRQSGGRETEGRRADPDAGAAGA
jgi:hypothetical protein